MLLAGRLGLEIGPTVFFDYPSPRALIEWLAGRLTHESPPPLVGGGRGEGGVSPPSGNLRTPPPDPLPKGEGEVLALAAAHPASRQAASLAVSARNRDPGSRDPGNRDPGDTDRFAILGMACRFPGGADTPAAYWRLLMSGADPIAEMPAERRALLGLAANDQAARRRAGYLSGVDRFDAGFFRIPSAEADALDPQHRLLLELAWESLEDAGIDPTTLAESSTGVFTGLFSHDYELLQVKRGKTGSLGAWLSTGNAAAMAAGRIAYFLGLRGPALTLDTACSSSLVAVHLACHSLRSGESDLALALGANLLLSPELTTAFDKAGMLAPDGCCKTFSAGADGYVRSEGAAAVVLKRLDRALADGDRIWGVVRGSAMNQDGASNGLTAPNGRAQQAVLRGALAAARTAPDQVSYIELHGTGTPLGDPVEFAALREVFGPTRAAAPPLVLGSVKTVIGHTEAAAGLAGLMKVVLALHHRTIPPHLHLGAVNPHIDLDALPASVPTAAIDWPGGSSDTASEVPAAGPAPAASAALVAGDPPVAGAAPVPPAMAGLDPAIRPRSTGQPPIMPASLVGEDGRVKPGHDGGATSPTYHKNSDGSGAPRIAGVRLVRFQRHQRPCHPAGGAGRRASWRAGGARVPCPGPVGPLRRRAAGVRRAPGSLACGPSRHRPCRLRLHPEHRPRTIRRTGGLGLRVRRRAAPKTGGLRRGGGGSAAPGTRRNAP